MATSVPQLGPSTSHVKEVIVNTPFVSLQPSLPLKISKIYYNVLGESTIRRLSVLPCKRVVRPQRDFGINDRRLGVCDRGSLCLTCGLNQTECVGHPGHIELDTPVFHLGYFTATLRICRTICKTCAHVLLTPEEKQYYRRKLNNASGFVVQPPTSNKLVPPMDPLSKINLIKQLQEDAYKTRVCLNCGASNGTVRRVRPLKIIHEKYSVTLRASESVDDGMYMLEEALRYASELNSEVEVGKQFVHDVLDPVRVKELFNSIPPEEICLLGLEPGSRPSDLLVSCMSIPPVACRPQGPPTSGSGAREDELSMQYTDILTSVDSMKETSLDPAKYAEAWDMLQTKVARIQDSGLPGFPVRLRTDCKSFAQRMKGKHGRFRGNLSGKRVDFSGRSVISPDPNLAIDEIAIPLRIARILTYPQRVFPGNLDAMRQMVLNGPDCHPGAITVTFTRENTCKGLMHFRDRESHAEKLAVGDIVERHMISGDLVLFNRQPSLHRISMMCHKARVLPFRTLRFNECCCSPYNADFDGDEMNIHLVQSEEARAEALTLMLTSQNIISAKNGEPIIACIQDFLTAAYLLTSRDMFFSRSQFVQCVSHWLNYDRFDLPFPTILKPTELWTGKQLFDVIVQPLSRKGDKFSLNIEASTKFYSGEKKHLCNNEGYVAFNNSQLICGRLDKKLLGGGAKDGLFARLHATAGGKYAAVVMSRIAQFTSRYLMDYGFSLGLGDVTPTRNLEVNKERVMKESFAQCLELIDKANSGTLEQLPGMSMEKSLDAQMNQVLSKVRETCGNSAVNDLTPLNAPLVMAQSGSKGSTLNIAQMIACVGQQTVNGKRIQNAFIDRSLPHYERFAEHPEARGFVSNSFYTSLKPTEFFFHTMAGREGLVDTAVKTAETGYIYRRLMKAMEDLSIKYDYTVRNSKNDIVQMSFGEDMLDPQLMEGSDGNPVNFTACWLQAVNTETALVARKRLENNITDDSVSKLKIMTSGESKNNQITSMVSTSADVYEHYSLMPIEVMDFVRMTLYSKDCFKRCSKKFKADVILFWEKKVNEQKKTRTTLGLCNNTRLSAAEGNPKNLSQKDIVIMEDWQTEVIPLTKGVVTSFMEECGNRYIRKICEPGTACGAIAAQSVGEPSTQMTLRTFHFAGVSSMSITQGVPRLVEIVNANKSISTPIVKAPLILNDGKSVSPLFALSVKAQIEKVTLKEITSEIVEVITPNAVYLRIKLNRRLISNLQLQIDAAVVKERILVMARRPMSILRKLTEGHIQVLSTDSLNVSPCAIEGILPLFSVKQLLKILPDVSVSGIPGINRAIITKRSVPTADGKVTHAEVIAEGAELLQIMNLEGVDGTKTTTNHVAAIEKVLGVEAARATIVYEIQLIMKAYALSIDIRHIYLLADVMTHRGMVLGITRYGIQKMNSGVLTMASFERTTEHLYNAAIYQRSDTQLSVSESIIVGNPVPLGSNSFQLYFNHEANSYSNSGSSLGLSGVSVSERKPLVPIASEFHI